MTNKLSPSPGTDSHHRAVAAAFQEYDLCLHPGDCQRNRGLTACFFFLGGILQAHLNVIE